MSQLLHRAILNVAHYRTNLALRNCVKHLSNSSHVYLHSLRFSLRSPLLRSSCKEPSARLLISRRFFSYSVLARMRTPCKVDIPCRRASHRREMPRRLHPRTMSLPVREIRPAIPAAMSRPETIVQTYGKHQIYEQGSWPSATTSEATTYHRCGKQWGQAHLKFSFEQGMIAVSSLALLDARWWLSTWHRPKGQRYHCYCKDQND